MVNDGNRRPFNPMANRQRFKPGGGGPPQSAMNRAMLYDANQLGDNPGFLDFNDDSISFSSSGNSGSNSSTANTAGGITNGAEDSQNGPGINGNRRMKRPMKNGTGGGMRPRMNGPNWGPPMAPPNSFAGPLQAGRRGQMHPPAIPPPPPPGGHFRNGGPGMGMRMRGPHNVRFGGGPPRPMPLLSMNAPLPPPVPPMGGGQPMPPPPGMGRMLPPPIRPHGGMMRRQPNGLFPGPRMHAFARNGMAPPNGSANGNRMGARAKPTQPNRDPFALDKPWVTEQIKAEHDKKEELANRLKGHRDDALFAQFKEQRDKFVKMYESARLEFIGKQQSEHQQKDVDKNLTEPVCKKARVENENEPSGTITNAPVEQGTTSSSVATTVTATPVETPVDIQESVNDGVPSIAATSSTTATTVTISSSSSNPCEISDTNEGSKIPSAPTEVESVTEATDAADASGTAKAKIS
ncbi:transcription elongation regulator 1 [Anopheles aquasalis]|uniref:transcription elongation regulator 1 n=1 Tax=Anopheles aquasalis TaxID=42839 RepID=UPI00215B1538|nr:transcription elongation regulator 1 [Anopheles aquasalis]